MNDKVSIIIPIYNTEKYLDDCIQSAINQTYSNIEIRSNAYKHYKLRTICNKLPYVDYTSPLNHQYVNE